MSEAMPPLRDFHGGLHLDGHKAESNGSAVQEPALPQRLTLPLQQHIGQIAECAVQVGDSVLKGQLIARASDYVSANIHAPTSGTIVEIAELPVAHPSGLDAPCLVIASDGDDRWAELPAPLDYLQTDPAELRERLRWAGIVGLGGAVFPTSVKTNTAGKPVDTLVIKCRRALDQTGRKRLVIAGGVGANVLLRERLKEMTEASGREVFYPRPQFCTDNGAMIAYAGSVRLAAGERQALDFSVRPRWRLTELPPIGGVRA